MLVDAFLMHIGNSGGCASENALFYEVAEGGPFVLEMLPAPPALFQIGSPT